MFTDVASKNHPEDDLKETKRDAESEYFNISEGEQEILSLNVYLLLLLMMIVVVVVVVLTYTSLPYTSLEAGKLAYISLPYAGLEADKPEQKETDRGRVKLLVSVRFTLI